LYNNGASYNIGRGTAKPSFNLLVARLRRQAAPGILVKNKCSHCKYLLEKQEMLAPSKMTPVLPAFAVFFSKLLPVAGPVALEKGLLPQRCLELVLPRAGQPPIRTAPRI
jgi:hypothetical protein